MGVDHIDELVSKSEQNIQNWLASGPVYDNQPVDVELGKNIMLLVGDGRKGVPSEGPYDAIHVGAAAPEIPIAVCQVELIALFS